MSILPFAHFSKGIYYLSQHSQTLIDLTAFFKPISLSLSQLLSLTTSQIDKIKTRFFNFLTSIFILTLLNVKSEYSMGSRRGAIHFSLSNMSIFLSIS